MTAGDGCLTVVGTPIGNLRDISPRAVEALAGAGVVYCEDTRRARKLFSALGIPAPRLVRLDRHNEEGMAPHVLAAVESGTRAVLVTDAGMPAVSDPGATVVRAVAAAGHHPRVVPGPDAVSAALAVSGLPASQYRFAGFPPRKGRERADLMADLARTPTTVVLYEAPGRVAATVADLARACGPDRGFAAARELTKVHEEVWRGTLGDAAEWLEGLAAAPRGEWVLLLAPLERRAAPAEIDEPALRAAVQARLDQGADRRRAVSEVAAELRVPRRRVYDAALALKAAGGGQS